MRSPSPAALVAVAQAKTITQKKVATPRTLYRIGVAAMISYGGSIPIHTDLSRGNQHVPLRAAVFDHIPQDCHVLFAIFRHAIFLPGPPPCDGLHTLDSLRRTQCVFRKLVELHSMPELLEEHFVYIK